MNSKSSIWILMIIGSSIGSFIPTLWGAGVFSLSSLVFGAIGAIFGIYIGYKMSN